MHKFCFIIIRHVREEKHNIFWNECYDNIRKFYKEEKIYIIDDNSVYPPERHGKLYNVEIIKSEFPKQRGELLPYYYYYKRNFSKNAVILHDTVYINSKINPLYLETTKFHILWNANHNRDHANGAKERTLKILSKLDNSKQHIEKYNTPSKWDVCFGAMSIINLDYLKSVFDNTNYFEILLSEIKSRPDRMCFERILPVLLTKGEKTTIVNGDIKKHQKWGTTYTMHKQKNTLDKNMYKIWVGR